MKTNFALTSAALCLALSLSNVAVADGRSKWGGVADGYAKQVHHRHHDYRNDYRKGYRDGYRGRHYYGGKRHFRQHRRHINDHRRHYGYKKHYRGHRYNRFPDRYYREHRRHSPRYGSSIGLWLDGVGLRYSERRYCD